MDAEREERCGAPFVRWDGTHWACQLDVGHVGDHYSGDDVRWTFWSAEATYG